jgi:hypothetical protein
MINVNQITSRLASMPDQALQQYAAMHKNDPYTMALALSESNRRKQMRQGAQMQAPQQPKVVDQEIAGMAAVDPMGNVTGYAKGGYLPEDTGIGQLPAPNMQNMAEGGIVAFEGGGEVPRYYDGALVGQGINRNPLVPPPSQNRNAAIANRMSDVATQAKEDEIRNIDLQLQSAPPGPQRDFLESRRRILAGASSTLPANTPYTVPGLPGAMTGASLPLVSTPAPTVTPGGNGKRSAPPPMISTEPPAAAKPTAGLPALSTTAPTAAQAKADAAALSDDTELRRSLENNEKFTTEAYEKLLGDYNKKVAELPEAYKGYEERLKKEEEAASNDKDKALGMAIFQAGLGMMAGTSQYAFENIGKGALAGLDNYQSALKDLKKAQRERDKAFADIEAARLAEKRGDLKASTELQAKGIEALGTAKNRTVDGIAKIFQVNTETAKGIFDTGLKDKAQNERTIYTSAVDLQKQGMADAAAMARTNAQIKGQKEIAQISTDAYKLPMLYKSVEDSVDKMLQADTNYRAADEVTKAAMRDAALRKRLLATPGLAQYAPAASGGGGGGLRYNEQTGKIE